MVDILINDVVLRDGLQDQPRLVEVADRAAIAKDLVGAGLRHLEVASFVSPARVPQMVGGHALLAALPRRPDVTFSAIALHARGADRAVAAGADEIVLVVSAGEGHSRSNAGRTVQDAMAEFAAWRASNPDATVTAGISTAFICPYDGVVAERRVIELVAEFADMGVGRITLADTLGTAPPEQVVHSTERIARTVPGMEVALHLHDAHGRALETVTEAVALGIHRFDSAAGGYGGCPFAPGAHGNLATEQLVAHLHSLGHETGVDVGMLNSAVDRIRATLAAAAPLP